MSEESMEAAASPAAPVKPPVNVVIQDLEGDSTKKVAYTKSFNVDYVNPETSERLLGAFTCKRPNLGDLSQFGVLMSRYNGGERVRNDIAWLNEMIAFCQVTLTAVPPWWDPLNSYDEELLTLVFNHVRSFQDSFRKRLG